MVTEELDPSFKALADATRREILARLLAGPRPVWELAAYFEMSRPAVSKHLKLLKAAGLVAEDRKGRERFYRLVPGPLGGVAEWLDAMEAGEPPLATVEVKPLPEPNSSSTAAEPRSQGSEPPDSPSEESGDAGDWRAW